MKVCREVTELYPNTNLVALIREKSEEFLKEKMADKKRAEERKRLGYEEPDYGNEGDAKKEWDELLKKLSKERAMKK